MIESWKNWSRKESEIRQRFWKGAKTRGETKEHPPSASRTRCANQRPWEDAACGKSSRGAGSAERGGAGRRTGPTRPAESGQVWRAWGAAPFLHPLIWLWISPNVCHLFRCLNTHPLCGQPLTWCHLNLVSHSEVHLLLRLILICLLQCSDLRIGKDCPWSTFSEAPSEPSSWPSQPWPCLYKACVRRPVVAKVLLSQFCENPPASISDQIPYSPGPDCPDLHSTMSS